MLEQAISWIESHPVTIQLLTWAALLILAWLSGGFKWLRRKTRKPRLKLIPTASSCLVEQFEVFRGKQDAVRASFLINAAVVNRSEERIVVEGFDLKYRRVAWWKRYGPGIGRATLPNRPRKQMACGVKFMGVFFTSFPDDASELTVTGKLDAKEQCGGYLLFVSFTFGTWNPLISGEGIKVVLSARLTTGERLTARAKIRANGTKEFFEQTVPGIVAQIEHETAWNIPV